MLSEFIKHGGMGSPISGTFHNPAKGVFDSASLKTVFVAFFTSWQIIGIGSIPFVG
ncbi:hypothetical protein THIOM_000448 [Candidatus Thiomargarita nelsonii]|uniref:Uncharacterized protein n=1 Tax=Candidatus Thiomargarita nelsonii TaxID=1003181 RepID=A0A176S6H8_9GAMM|nr:hypothetical protein THIOM_000448 [Candidatus Thiomargarita nelsonii]